MTHAAVTTDSNYTTLGYIFAIVLFLVALYVWNLKKDRLTDTWYWLYLGLIFFPYFGPIPIILLLLTEVIGFKDPYHELHPSLHAKDSTHSHSQHHRPSSH